MSFVKSTKSFLKDAMTENLRLKLIALFVAVLLVTLVRFQEEDDRIFDVQIVPVYPAEGHRLIVTSQIPETVRVRLRGPKSRINSLKQDAIQQAEMDLSHMHEGTSNFYFNKRMFKIPSGFELVRITPESTHIKIEKLISRRLPVRVRTTGRLRDGTELVDPPSVNPKEVVATGATSIMRNKRAVFTEDVDLEGLGDGAHIKILPIRLQEGVEIQGGDQLEVRINVRWIPGQRMISGMLVELEGAVLAHQIAPKEVAVALSGPQVLLHKLDLSNLKAVVKMTEDKGKIPGVYIENVEVRGVPDKIKITSIAPKKVQINLAAPAPLPAANSGKKVQ